MVLLFACVFYFLFSCLFVFAVIVVKFRFLIRDLLSYLQLCFSVLQCLFSPFACNSFCCLPCYVFRLLWPLSYDLSHVAVISHAQSIKQTATSMSWISLFFRNAKSKSLLPRNNFVVWVSRERVGFYAPSKRSTCVKQLWNVTSHLSPVCCVVMNYSHSATLRPPWRIPLRTF